MQGERAQEQTLLDSHAASGLSGPPGMRLLASLLGKAGPKALGFLTEAFLETPWAPVGCGWGGDQVSRDGEDGMRKGP